jgi:putative membrane protein
MSTLSFSAIALLSTILLTGCAATQRAAPSTMSDANIVSVFNTIDQSEIEAAELARQKAASPVVREYAARIVQDHTVMMDKKQGLANRLNMRPEKPQLASTLESKNQEEMSRLRQKSGADFDRSYIDYQIMMHEQAIKLAQDSASSVNESRIKQQLTDSRPDLQSHLTEAQSIRQQLAGKPLDY